MSYKPTILFADSHAGSHKKGKHGDLLVLGFDTIQALVCTTASDGPLKQVPVLKPCEDDSTRVMEIPHEVTCKFHNNPRVWTEFYQLYIDQLHDYMSNKTVHVVLPQDDVFVNTELKYLELPSEDLMNITKVTMVLGPELLLVESPKKKIGFCIDYAHDTTVHAIYDWDDIMCHYD